MAEWFVGPIRGKIIDPCSDYLEEQVGWQTCMKKEMESLRENHPKIQAVVFAANKAQISDQNPALNKWIWQLRDAVDEADDVLDEFEFIRSAKTWMKQIRSDAEEACSAKLCVKRRLIDLTLKYWSCIDSRNIDLDEKVLDNLQPPNCLTNLEIHKYMGAMSAIWMNNVNLISNLEKIELTVCTQSSAKLY